MLDGGRRIHLGINIINEETQDNKQKQGDHCQCDIRCNNPPLPHSAFCKVHGKGKCKRRSPMTGYEPKYQPALWNIDEHRETHNCYAYFMNILDSFQIEKCQQMKNCDALPFPQPGNAAGYTPFKTNEPKTCPNMIARILGDNSNITMTTFEEKCPPLTSKGALVVDENEDYHFLRQDVGGWWSQKGGAKTVTNRDASGRPIWDPALANNRWSNTLDYDIFCGYFCIPRTTGLKIVFNGGSRKRKTRKVKQPRSLIRAKKYHISRTMRSRDRTF